MSDDLDIARQIARYRKHGLESRTDAERWFALGCLDALEDALELMDVRRKRRRRLSRQIESACEAIRTQMGT